MGLFFLTTFGCSLCKHLKLWKIGSYFDKNPPIDIFLPKISFKMGRDIEAQAAPHHPKQIWVPPGITPLAMKPRRSLISVKTSWQMHSMYALCQLILIDTAWIAMLRWQINQNVSFMLFDTTLYEKEWVMFGAFCMCVSWCVYAMTYTNIHSEAFLCALRYGSETWYRGRVWAYMYEAQEHIFEATPQL